MFEYAVYNKKDICIYQSNFQLPCRNTSKKIDIGKYVVEVETENEIGARYILKKILGQTLKNKKLSDQEKNNILVNLCNHEKRGASSLSKGLEKLKASNILREKGVFIDIIEELHVVFDLNKLISGAIVGRVFVRGTPQKETKIGISENDDINVIQGDLDSKKGYVFVKNQQILTYVRPQKAFTIPVSVSFDKVTGFLTIKNNSQNSIKDLKVNIPIDCHTYAKSTYVDGAKSKILESEQSIDWIIENLGTSPEQNLSRIQLEEKYLPNKLKSPKNLKILFSIPFYSDPGISIKYCDIDGVRQKDVFISTICQTKVYDVRIL